MFPRMSSYGHSTIINYSVNLAYGGYADNHSLYHPQSLEMLNAKFIDGYMIEMDKIDTSKVISSHTETKFKFIKDNR